MIEFVGLFRILSGWCFKELKLSDVTGPAASAGLLDFLLDFLNQGKHMIINPVMRPSEARSARSSGVESDSRSVISWKRSRRICSVDDDDDEAPAAEIDDSIGCSVL